MRRLRPLCLALAGMALFAPSVVRADDPPGSIRDEEGHLIMPTQKKDRTRARGVNVYNTPPVNADGTMAHPPRLCAACAAKMVQEGQMKVVSQANIAGPNGSAPVMMVNGMPATYAGPIAANGTCAACASGEAHAGHAMVGEPTGGTPGLAFVGQESNGAEPAPVGIVRTSYGTGASPAAAPGTLGASVAGYASTAGGMAHAKPEEVPSSLFQAPTPRRHHIIAHILGIPTGRRLAAENEAKARSAHAMISYGNNGSAPSELPASMVYGGK